MTGMDQEDNGVFVQGDGTEPGQHWVRSRRSVLRHAASPVSHDLVKEGHAFYVVDVNNLFGCGGPCHLNCSQSSAGLS